MGTVQLMVKPLPGCGTSGLSLLLPGPQFSFLCAIRGTMELTFEVSLGPKERQAGACLGLEEGGFHLVHTPPWWPRQSAYRTGLVPCLPPGCPLTRWRRPKKWDRICWTERGLSLPLSSHASGVGLAPWQVPMGNEEMRSMGGVLSFLPLSISPYHSLSSFGFFLILLHLFFSFCIWLIFS